MILLRPAKSSPGILAAGIASDCSRSGLFMVLVATALTLTGQSAAQSDVASPPPAPQEVFGRVSPAIYIVEGLDEHGDGVSVASAVAVGANELVTNKHAINAGGLLRVRRAEKGWSATVDKLDETADLAILRVDDLDATGAPEMRGSDSLKVGERVFAVGAPYGLELSLSDGLIAGLRHENDVVLVQTTAPISKGSSGGGLFDARGRLIGITTFYLSGSQNLNFAIGADRIATLRERNCRGYSEGLGSRSCRHYKQCAIGRWYRSSADRPWTIQRLGRTYGAPHEGVTPRTGKSRACLQRVAPP